MTDRKKKQDFASPTQEDTPEYKRYIREHNRRLRQAIREAKGENLYEPPEEE